MAAETSDRPPLEVADIVRLHGEDYRRAHAPSDPEEIVLRHIAQCRTAALGGHLDECPDCGHPRPSYNSCRDPEGSPHFGSPSENYRQDAKVAKAEKKTRWVELYHA